MKNLQSVIVEMQSGSW